MTYDFYNGIPPHVRDSDTSYFAAISQLPKAATKRKQVVGLIGARGAVGATCDECEIVLGMPHTTCSARIREAVLDNEVRDSGERRNTQWNSPARVYVLVPHQQKMDL